MSVKETSKVPKSIWTIHTAVGCQWNLIVKILLLKTPHALVTGQRNQAAINWSTGPDASSMMTRIHSAGRYYKVSGGETGRGPCMQCYKLAITNLPLFHQRAHLAGQFITLPSESSAMFSRS